MKTNENENQLQMAVVPQGFLNEVSAALSDLKNILNKKSEEEINSQWIESTAARKMLHVSQKTWQTYRDRRIIPFAQFGAKIYVKRADIEAFLKQHYITK